MADPAVPRLASSSCGGCRSTEPCLDTCTADDGRDGRPEVRPTALAEAEVVRHAAEEGRDAAFVVTPYAAYEASSAALLLVCDAALSGRSLLLLRSPPETCGGAKRASQGILRLCVA